MKERQLTVAKENYIKINAMPNRQTIIGVDPT
jgi:hypothetical protein